MKTLRNLLLTSAAAILMIVSSAQQTQAADLEVVFKDSLWGACIGAAAGLAFWGLANSDEGDKMGPSMGQGAALGLLLGIGYGLYEINVAYNNVNPQKPVTAFAYYDRNTNKITVSPFNLLPASYSQNDKGLTIKSTLLHASF